MTVGYDPIRDEPGNRRAYPWESAPPSRAPSTLSVRNRRPRPRCTTCGALLHHGDCLDCGPLESTRENVRHLCGADTIEVIDVDASKEPTA